MYRMNAQSRAIEEKFLTYGIRYQIVGGTRFYQRREVKDALAYLRVLRSDTDNVSFERIINVPARGIGDKSIEALRRWAVGHERRHVRRAARPRRRARSQGLAPRIRTAIAEFAALLRRLRTRIGVLPLPELLDEVLEASGYRAMLADGSEEGEDRWANLLELRQVTTRYDDLSPDDALDRLLEETALVADQDAYEGEADAVTLITLHAAKGLEFPVVFIAGLEEGLFPHNRALDDEKELEEERRLAYVGHHAGEAPAVPLARLAAGDLGRRRDERPVAVPARDPGRADGRAAAPPGRRLRARHGSRPRVRRPAVPARVGDPLGRRRRIARGAAGPARRRRGRRSGRRATSGRSARRSPRARRPARWGRSRARRGRSRSGRSCPGERRYRDGDRVHHARWGDGIVITSKLTRDDEEVTVGFSDPIGRPQDDAREPREPRGHGLADRSSGVRARAVRGYDAACRCRCGHAVRRRGQLERQTFTEVGASPPASAGVRPWSLAPRNTRASFPPRV